jgi:hypothetical protein
MPRAFFLYRVTFANPYLPGGYGGIICRAAAPAPSAIRWGRP